MNDQNRARGSTSAAGPKPRRCGFRFSATDAAVIVVAAAATQLLWEPIGNLSLLFPVVVAHFFLFCNVFRIRRSFELIWAAAFVVNLAAWQAAGALTWANVLAVQAPVTAAAILAEMRGPRYHGVGCSWINPNHPGHVVAGESAT